MKGVLLIKDWYFWNWGKVNHFSSMLDFCFGFASCFTGQWQEKSLKCILKASLEGSRYIGSRCLAYNCWAWRRRSMGFWCVQLGGFFLNRISRNELNQGRSGEAKHPGSNFQLTDKSTYDLNLSMLSWKAEISCVSPDNTEEFGNVKSNSSHFTKYVYTHS